MMLPGFGIMSEVISVFCRKPIFGYRLMALSLMAIVVLGFSVWAHHMFVSGMASWLRVPMMITTLLIAVPTGIKIFSWLATIWEGKLHFNTPFLFALGFLSMFVIGGLSGVMLGAVPIDIHVSDTYFIVAHIHYVLFGGSVFTIFAGMYYWFPKMTGRMYNERLGKLHFWLTFVGFNLTFFPMHLDRRRGDAAPRRRLRAEVREPEHVHLARVVRARRVGARVPLQHDHELAQRPDRAGEPVARADARVAGELAAADLQLHEIPQVVGSPYEYGVPGAEHAILDAAPRDARPTEVGPRDLTAGRPARPRGRERDRRLAGADRPDRGEGARARVLVTVLAPVNQPRQGYVVYYDTRRAAARRRLDKTLDLLRAAGVHATASSSRATRSRRCATRSTSSSRTR